MKKLIISLALLVLLPYNLYADVWKNPTVEDVRIEGSSTVEICSGTGDIKLSTGCGGAGTIYSITLDATDGSFDFAGNIALENDQYLTGEDTSGTARNLIGINSSNDVVIGVNNGALDLSLLANDDIILTPNDDLVLQGQGSGDIITLAGGGTSVDLTIADNLITVADGTEFHFADTATIAVDYVDTGSILNLETENTIKVALMADAGEAEMRFQETVNLIGTYAASGNTAQMTFSSSRDPNSAYGSYLTAYGNSHATSAGDLNLTAGDVSGGNITLTTPNATSNIYFYAGTSGVRWGVGSTSTATLTGYASSNVINTSAATADLCLAGGTSCASSSGSYVYVDGNTGGTTGTLTLQSGTASGADIRAIVNNSTSTIELEGTTQIEAYSSVGHAYKINTAREYLNITSSVASISTTNLIPAGARLLGCTARVDEAIVGPTSIDIGDGTDVDKFAATLGLTLGTQMTEANWTADPENWSASTQDVTVTCNGANCTDGAVDVLCTYTDFDANAA